MPLGLGFFGEVQELADRRAFLRYLAPLRRKNWVVYAKPPFAGPEAVLAYLARYTHRVAISNRRIAMDERGVTFHYKDYRRDGAARYQTMTLAPAEFIRRSCACVAKGLPSATSLRAVRQRQPQGQHRPHPRSARGASAGRAGSADRRGRARTMAPLPMLRRAYDHP